VLDHSCWTHFLGEVDWCSTGCTASWCHRLCSIPNLAVRRRQDLSNMRRRQDLSNKMRRRPDFLTKSWLVLCPIHIVCHSFYTNHSSESSNLLFLINELIKYQSINPWPAYSTFVFPTEKSLFTNFHYFSRIFKVLEKNFGVPNS
jgi:hypothetical protein